MARISGSAAGHFLGRRAFLAAVGAGLLAVPSEAQARERAGSVEDVRGEAFAEAASERRTLARAAPVFIADQVGTGSQSRLAMRLGQDTTVRLGEMARVTIDRFLVNAGGGHHVAIRTDVV